MDCGEKGQGVGLEISSIYPKTTYSNSTSCTPRLIVDSSESGSRFLRTSLSSSKEKVDDYEEATLRSQINLIRDMLSIFDIYALT